MSGDTTEDAFLRGRLHLKQPRKGYRAGIDPVMLAASVAAKPGQSVLDLGCGVGAALFCLGARVAGLSLTGVELQPDYADLARTNARTNGITARIVTSDIQDLPADLRQERFDHVIANPPYFDAASGSASEDAGKDVAFRGPTPVATWVEIASRRLGPKGRLTLILRTQRLPEVLVAVPPSLGSVTVRPISARVGRAPDRFLLQARKGGKAPFCLLAPLVLHEGDSHEGDAESYTPAIRQVLRDAAELKAFGD